MLRAATDFASFQVELQMLKAQRQLTILALRWIRMLTVGFTPHGLGFGPKTIHVGFVVDRSDCGSFSTSASVFPFQYQSSNARYLFTDLLPTLRNRYNWHAIKYRTWKRKIIIHLLKIPVWFIRKIFSYEGTGHAGLHIGYYLLNFSKRAFWQITLKVTLGIVTF